MIFTNINENNEIIFNESVSTNRYEKNIKYNKSLKESNTILLASTGNNGGGYIHDALYESYLQSKIDAEDRLAFALKESMIISEADYSNIRVLQEAKLSDKIKVKWLKFIAFIKRMVAKFLESMNNILLDEKEYLEKYKDIILKKKPKDDLTYSYTGKYETGINRLINTSVPLFNYATYKDALEAEDDNDAALIKKIMPGDFSYTNADTLDEQCKGYFLAYEAGQQEGKFSSIKMVDLYNFCYNFSKIKKQVDTDLNRLETSTRAIESEINKQLKEAPATTMSNDNSVGDNSESDSGGSSESSGGERTSTPKQGEGPVTPNSQEESAILYEAEEGEKPKGVEIKTTAAATKMNTTEERDTEKEKGEATASAKQAKKDNVDTTKITKAADKWIRVCRSIISAKLTAYQQISTDYMKIIRAHVRSYGGTDKKDKTGDRAPETSTEYSKEDSKKALEDAKKEAKKADQQVRDASEGGGDGQAPS